MALIRDISLALQMSEEDIARIVETAPRRYKVYAIPKRHGAGDRTIAQPARELKEIQRYLIATKMTALPVHQIATAYKTGKSILDNAWPHRNKRVILKLDFKDFFHSITPADLLAIFKSANFKTIERADWHLLSQIFFWHNHANGTLCLSIGAPSSPHISNLIMERLDRQIWQISKECSAICTRYADDITLSGNSIETLLKAERKIRLVVGKATHPRLIFNDEKRGIYTTAGRRIVTGLVITPDRKISLGRERKRKISAALHNISIGKSTSKKLIAETRGWLAYAKSVEPTFFASMSRKYGSTVQDIMSSPIIRDRDAVTFEEAE